MKQGKILYYLFLVFLVIGLGSGVLFSSNGGTESKSHDDQIRLIVRGDDMGFCHAANLGCLEAYKNGIATTAEVMVPCPWFGEAAKMLNETPGLDVGVHLTLTSEWDIYKWKPVLPVTQVPSLVDKNGYFFSDTSQFLKADPKLNEVEKEVRAQIELAVKKIPHITHLSYHMSAMTATPELTALVKKLGKEYKLTLSQYVGDKFINWIYSVPPKKKEDALAKILEHLRPGLWLFVCHPGMDTPEMRAIKTSSDDATKRMSIHRQAVTDALTSERIKEIIEGKGIKLVNYRDLKKD
jgi:predicted glycoside hydrolase/deacetylase ChbG (UPF0249 family)